MCVRVRVCACVVDPRKLILQSTRIPSGVFTGRGTREKKRERERGWKGGRGRRKRGKHEWQSWR